MKEFLESRWDGKSPLCLAYSGGPDSRALFFALLRWGKAPIHLAHVDHGWREESRQESALLQNEAEQLGVPFHLHRLEKRTTEEEARELRLQFFSKLKKKVPYQALLMGHQANDLAETALKRLFEGAHLPRLFGMRSESLLHGILIWRPLLKVPRKAIEEAGAIIDPSNRDPRYLRARMRLTLLPFLEKEFGKGVLENLRILAERSLELDAYLARRVERIELKTGPFGVSVHCDGAERVELRYLVQEICPMPRDALETLLDWAYKRDKGREMVVGRKRIIADRGYLFFLKEELPGFQEKILLPFSGWIHSGDWKLHIGSVDGPGGWRSLWQSGESTIAIPAEGPHWLSLPPPGIQWKDRTPAFLRKICPCILGREGVVGNFLSPRNQVKGKFIKIFIEKKIL